MSKKRVHEIAKEHGLSSKELLEKLKAAGVEAKPPPPAPSAPPVTPAPAEPAPTAKPDAAAAAAAAAAERVRPTRDSRTAGRTRWENGACGARRTGCEL